MLCSDWLSSVVRLGQSVALIDFNGLDCKGKGADWLPVIQFSQSDEAEEIAAGKYLYKKKLEQSN